MPAVEGISRKWARRKDVCVNKSIALGSSLTNKVEIPGQAYFGSVSKTVTVNGYGPVVKNTLFMRKPIYLGDVTDAQLTQRELFAAALAWTNEALYNLSAIAVNEARYKAALADFTKTINGVSAKGYQGMKGWMSAVAIATKKATGSLPQNYQLPEFDA